MMKCVDRKRITFWVLMAILLFQLGLSVYYGSKKSSLFIDEVLSYTLANHQGGGFIDLPQEEWLDESWYVNGLSTNSDQRFNYSIPYENQIEDVHPPLYYFFLHTSSSFIPGRVSYWAGIGWNILFFMGSTILMYLLGKKVFGDKKCALLSAFFYSISFGGLNTMTFIRMYMLMTFFLLLHTYVYVRFMDSEKISFKAYIFLGLTLTAGALTQYYFLIAAFFYGLWYTVKFLSTENGKPLFLYLGTVGVSACVSVGLFPAMLKHIFCGGRGVEARTNFISGENYLTNLKKMFSILDSQMFYGMFVILAVGIVILIMVRELRGGQRDWIRGAILLFVSGGYFFLVTKVAPYQTDRYLMAIYPLIYMFVIGNLYLLIRKYIGSKLTVICCVVLFGGLSVLNLRKTPLPYLYEKSVKEYNAVMDEYKDNFCVYIGVDSDYQYYDMQELREYKSFYNIVELNKDEKTVSGLNRLRGENSIILYLGKRYTLEEAESYLKSMLGDTFAGDVEQVQENSWRTIYLVKKISE